MADYIDRMLGMFSGLGDAGVFGSLRPVFAGGPWSNRHASGPDLMASFIALDPVRTIAWRRRLSGWHNENHGINRYTYTST